MTFQYCVLQENTRMPMFMAQFAYTPQAWSSLIHAPQDCDVASDSEMHAAFQKAATAPNIAPKPTT